MIFNHILVEITDLAVDNFHIYKMVPCGVATVLLLVVVMANKEGESMDTTYTT